MKSIVVVVLSACAISSQASPTTSFIAFSCGEDVCAANADGSRLRTLTRAHDQVTLAWSPDGSRIAFVRQNDIWVMNADGGHARRLTRAKIKDINDLAWTPHARTITFVASYIFSQIGIANTDGSGQRLLVRDAGQNDDDPAWSPDGRRLVFRSDREGSGQLYVADRNGRSQAPLLPAGQPYGAPSSPAWSPDARLIAFVGSKASFPENISRGAVYVMRPDGSQVRRLTGPRIASPVAIRWSPNGKSIAFACLQGKQTYRGAEPKRICIVGRDGAGFSKLSGPASTYDDPVASWSPHGRWLAYDACNQLSCRVVITPASGGKWHTLGNSRVRNATPAWQPRAR